MPENCDAIAIFTIYSQFGAIWKLESGRIICKIMFALIIAIHLTKTENRTKKFLTQLSHYCFG